MVENLVLERLGTSEAQILTSEEQRLMTQRQREGHRLPSAETRSLTGMQGQETTNFYSVEESLERLERPSSVLEMQECERP